MGVILFVHGMGYSNDRDYWKEWAAPLQLELARQGLTLTEEQFGGVYYYDLVPGPYAGKIPTEDILQIQILGLKKKATEELSSLRSPFEKTNIVIGNFVDYLVDNFGDIFSYLYLSKTHQQVNERLYEAIDQYSEPVILLGYSLGTIVSLCALLENRSAANKIAHLLMLGSPLYWFVQGVANCVDLSLRPAVGRFTNLAGLLDIAWPQMVPKILTTLDNNIEYRISFNPIKGHTEYFSQKNSLKAISGEIIKGWF
ncbi:MAG: Alpha/beta hydrolase family protein [Pelotomaculum sp. PtaB.Bin104]|nr:MAG: Alpha/beta hydrolase family protein [Pelotomaculum sp. PtaB.Bin104]